jgi:sugar phosphate isomerase/epimerase
MAVGLRPGFVHYATFPDVRTPEQLVDAIALVLDNGFKVVELSSMLGPALLERAAQVIRERAATLFLSAGPEFVRTRRSLCDVRVDARVATVRRVWELIDLAAALGAENLMLVSGADPGPDQRATARAALVDSMQRIAEYGRARPAPRITLETFARERPPAQLLGPTAETLALLDAVGAAELGVTIDLSHLVQLGEDVGPAAASLAPRSTHVHLSTCVLASGHPLDGDQHPSFNEPGIALSLDAAALAIRGLALGDGVVSVEIRRHHGEAAGAFVRECARYWRTAVGEHLRTVERTPQ